VSCRQSDDRQCKHMDYRKQVEQHKIQCSLSPLCGSTSMGSCIVVLKNISSFP
jgi:hypothetical protein